MSPEGRTHFRNHGQEGAGLPLPSLPVTQEACGSCPCNSGPCLLEGSSLPKGATLGRAHSKGPIELQFMPPVYLELLVSKDRQVRREITILQGLLTLIIRRMEGHVCMFVVVVQSLSRIQLCNPMDCSTPGFPVLHCLSEFAQTHVH